ncbi:MAG TPA: VWA domain-containing protein [Thermoanaerobaculia bacterium]|nr:VWA domain-containing protein [Thermoanaerobaculia bacterium]
MRDLRDIPSAPHRWGRYSRVLLAALALLLAGGAGAGTADAPAPPAGAPATIQIAFLSPAPATPIFGEVDLAVQVASPEPILGVEFFLDGKRVGEIKHRPFRVRADAGQENVEHQVQAVVHTISGLTGTASLTAPAVVVNEELNVALRQLFVTVVGGGSKRVLNLDRSDFRIVDNGVEQKLVTFERGEIPFNAVLLMDTSESMRGARLEGSRAGARAFLAGMKDVDEASLLLFSDRLLAATPFTSDRKVFDLPLQGTSAEGGTAINDHLYLALKLLDGQVGRGAIILFSDGTDVQSVMRMKEVLWKERRSQALIYWIQLNEDGGGARAKISSSWRDYEANEEEFSGLQRSVIESGGRIETIDSVAGVEAAFREILSELRDQYVLGFYPSNPHHDGSWHQVKVKIAKGDGLHVRTRGGYVDH